MVHEEVPSMGVEWQFGPRHVRLAELPRQVAVVRSQDDHQGHCGWLRGHGMQEAAPELPVPRKRLGHRTATESVRLEQEPRHESPAELGR